MLEEVFQRFEGCLQGENVGLVLLVCFLVT